MSKGLPGLSGGRGQLCQVWELGVARGQGDQGCDGWRRQEGVQAEGTGQAKAGSVQPGL